MNTVDHRDFLKGFFEEFWNKRDESAIERYTSPDLVEHGLAELAQMSMNRDEYIVFRATLTESFPDIHIRVDDVLSEGEFCAIRYTFTGTHLGEALGFPATGRSVSISGLSTGRIQDGKLVEAWNCLDKLGMLRQLGMA